MIEPSPTRQRGFTMIELIVVMIIVGIMAAAVVPRMSLLGGFDARGYADQIEAYLRFAQKSALAQRRTVRLELTSTTTSAPVLCVAKNYSATVACAAACSDSSMAALALPGTFRSARDTSITNATPICFYSMGNPSVGSTLSMEVKDGSGATARTVKVEAETGYVHSN